MENIKGISWVAKGLFFAIAFLVLTELNASTMVKLSLTELCNKSSAIVKCKVVSFQTYSDIEGKIFTNYRVEVVGSLKGEKKQKDIVDILTYGGTINGKTTIVVGSPKFTIGDEAILFLTKNTSHKMNEKYRVVGMAQGKFNISKESKDGSELVSRDGMGDLFKESKNGNDIILRDHNSIALQDFINKINANNK